jgi:hypothetical protein
MMAAELRRDWRLNGASLGSMVLAQRDLEATRSLDNLDTPNR